MSAKHLFGSLVLFHAALCLGQEPPGQPPIQPGRLGGPMAPRGPMSEIGPLVERMKTELKLDEGQSAEISRILSEYQKEAAELRGQMRQSPETMKQMSELQQKMKQARDANDQEGIKKVSEEVQALRKAQSERVGPAREKLAAMDAPLRDKLKAALREDQKPGFDKIWDEHMGPGGGQRMLRQNPRLLRATVDRLSDLTPDQKKQIADLFKQFDEATKGQRGPAASPQAQQLFDSVMAALTPEQREKVETRMQGRGPRHPAMPPGERRPQPPEKAGP